MTELKYREVRKLLLTQLEDAREYTYLTLGLKIPVSEEVIKKHCADLEKIKAVTIVDDKISITISGQAAASKL